MSDSAANKDYLKLHKEIAKQVNSLIDQVEFANLALIDGYLQEQVKQKKPIASVIDVPIDAKQFFGFVQQIAEISVGNQPHLQETMDAITTALKTTDETEKFIEATKCLNSYYFADFAERNSLNGAIVQFLAEMAYRPYIKALAKLLDEKVKFEGYNHNMCPVCGEKARLARGAEDGKREACCTRCDTVWEIQRLQCPHCKNEKHEDLKYIVAGDDENRKLYVCESCKGYIKIVNLKDQLGTPSFFIIDLETIHLDMVASQEGYGEEAESNSKVM
ncbi:formate dehydrogenase accessory protein FdhE [Desulfuribacillus stibiiarsenatis]|nr:formate dehydrogenase accessory protein FdhE [Desulfuribacillus stibiiarsenatis]